MGVDCKSADGKFPTQFRIIVNETQQDQLYTALKQVCKVHNLDNVKVVSLGMHYQADGARPILQRYTSTMRSATASAMDHMDTADRKAHVIHKRGALKWMPVWFANDMVHGSWWFVVGSVAFVVSSVVMLENSFHHELGDDDSFLSRFRYRASWVLMIISGVFCTLGSLAFVRAVHESPPMPPLFSWYHLQSDELLGSWLFLCATLPIIPYSLIYLAASHENVSHV